MAPGGGSKRHWSDSAWIASKDLSGGHRPNSRIKRVVRSTERIGVTHQLWVLGQLRDRLDVLQLGIA